MTMVLRSMLAILVGLAITIALLSLGLRPRRDKALYSKWGLAPKSNFPKRCTELWFFGYAIVWISVMAFVVASGCYEAFTASTYICVCGGLALPLYLQPLLRPGLTGEADVPIALRHSFRANVWLAIFGFAGNYWYTHYFYSVLGAAYTMPSYRLNDVPIAMFFATHFYFCFYHVISNCMLRKIDSYEPSKHRFLFKLAAVTSLSYLTAFLETFTISSFPYWTFQDRDSAYILGSAFYGIYFMVSFPMYYSLDELPPTVVLPAGANVIGARQSLVSIVKDALAASILVLYLLDFVRLILAIPFQMQIRPIYTP